MQNRVVCESLGNLFGFRAPFLYAVLAAESKLGMVGNSKRKIVKVKKPYLSPMRGVVSCKKLKW